MLTNMSKLLLFNNKLTDLPLTLGHLYKLEVLGLLGNSVADEYMDILQQRDTKALVADLKERIQRKQYHIWFMNNFGLHDYSFT